MLETLINQLTPAKVFEMVTRHGLDGREDAEEFILMHFNSRVKAGCSSKELREIVSMNCKVLDYFKTLETNQTTKGA